MIEALRGGAFGAALQRRLSVFSEVSTVEQFDAAEEVRMIILVLLLLVLLLLVLLLLVLLLLVLLLLVLLLLVLLCSC